MPPIVKDTEIASSASDVAAARPETAGEDLANRPQPVALEIPVNVNGARGLEGSEKREPFSEATKTVLVFGNGAVIRLNSPVMPGQLLFLTNEKTRKEVICQVVKSKNYRNVSGYVELEFTEPVVGFWGLRFPGDRIGQQTAAPLAPVPARPGPAPSASLPAAIAGSSPAEPKLNRIPVRVPEPPQLPASPLHAASELSPFPSTPVARAPELPISASLSRASVDLSSPRVQSAGQEASHEVASPLASRQPPLTASGSLAEERSKPVTPRPKVSGQSATESLEQKNALLQEQLSAAVFAEQQSSKAAPAVPAPHSPKSVDEASHRTEKLPPESNVVAGVQFSSPSLHSTIDSDEVKIPSWLEPLARNAANAATAQQKTEEVDNVQGSSDSSAIFEPLAASAENSAPSNPMFDEILLNDSSGNAEKRSSNKGFLIGALAAGLAIAAGGVWFYLRPANSQGTAIATHARIAEPRAAAGDQPVQTSQVSEPLAPPYTQPASRPQITEPQATTGASSPASHAPQSAQPASRSEAAKQNVPTAVNSVPARAQIAATAEKRPSLGEVRLAKPSIARDALSSTGSDGAPVLAVGGEQMTPGGDALGAGIVSTESKQPVAPAAPLVIGGDVKAARLLSSTRPIYPSLARAQHVAGDVLIDALIDADGHVSSMKVVSGPVLLHQSAKDALRQWKYQPATLDGKPVSMHLVVTIQFRLE